MTDPRGFCHELADQVPALESREVHRPIPAFQFADVALKLICDYGWKLQTQAFEFVMDKASGRHQAAASGGFVPRRISIWNSRIEIDAGVTPGIRLACAIDCGWIRVSFSAISLDKPGIAA